jgi:hypothetical protein
MGEGGRVGLLVSLHPSLNSGFHVSLMYAVAFSSTADR